MTTTECTNIIKKIPSLTPLELRLVSLKTNQSLSEKTIYLSIEKRLKNLNACVHCRSRNIVRWGHSHNLQRFRCKSCHKTFNELTKTPFARMRKRDELGRYAQSMCEGKTLREAAKISNIVLSTSFRWRHKLLSMPEKHKAKRLAGIVEVDETFFRESFKGKRNIHHRKPRRHGKAAKGEKVPLVPVLIALDRTGKEADFVLKNKGQKEIHPCLKGRVKKGAVLCSDGSHVYSTFAKKEGIYHKRIISTAPLRRLDDGAFHIQNLNNYTQRLKGWMRRFNGVGTAYLKNYLAWWRGIAFNKLVNVEHWLDEALVLK